MEPKLVRVPEAGDIAKAIENTPRVGISAHTHEEHLKLWQGYANKTNQIRKELIDLDTDPTKANQIYSQVRALKEQREDTEADDHSGRDWVVDPAAPAVVPIAVLERVGAILRAIGAAFLPAIEQPARIQALRQAAATRRAATVKAVQPLAFDRS